MTSEMTPAASRPTVLLTNDDGIRAPGILALYRELAAWLDPKTIAVVAPADHQSATGHGITLSRPLMTYPVTVEGGFTGTAVEGRPADCVKVAIDQIVKPAPDLVISGMNAGANVGINNLYSGTVAAAIEAAFLGKPAIAVSLHLLREVPTDYAWGAKLALDTIKTVLQHHLARPAEVLSINIPALPPGTMPAGTQVVRQCTRPWPDVYDRRTSPDRKLTYFWPNSIWALGDADPDTDVYALKRGFITITPLQFDLTHHERLQSLQSALQR